MDIVHQMLTLMYDEAPYVVLYYSPDLQAYRTDKYEGWIKQPKDVGPVLFSNTSPTYFNLKPISTKSDGGSGGGMGAGLVAALVAAGIVVLGGGGFYLVRRRSSAGRTRMTRLPTS